MLESSRRIGGHTSWPRVARSRGRLVVSPSSTMSRGFLLASVTFAFAASVLPPGARAYSSLAGSCDHAGVFHGVDRVEPQAGEGGYDLRLGHPGVNVPGATVPVLLTGAEKHKGMLVFAVNQEETATLGAWDASEMPDGCQVHPHCTHAATHDAFHNTGIVDDTLPWIVPADLTPGTVVRFKITVVRDYETWYAFEREFVVGSAAGAGDPALKLSSSRSGAPGSKRAPGMGKAVEGGWHAPGETAREEPTAFTAARTRSESASGSASDAPDARRAPAATDLGIAARPVASGGRKADAGGVSGSIVVPASPEEARVRRRCVGWRSRRARCSSRGTVNRPSRGSTRIAAPGWLSRAVPSPPRGTSPPSADGRRRGDATEKSARSRARWCWRRRRGDTTANGSRERRGRDGTDASAASSRASGRITARGVPPCSDGWRRGWGGGTRRRARSSWDGSSSRRRRNRGDERACTDSNWGEPREEASGERA